MRSIVAILLICISCSTKNEAAEVVLCKTSPFQNKKLVVLDSTQINAFIAHHPQRAFWKNQLLSFYKNRNYRYAWVNEKGLESSANKLIDLINSELIQGKKSVSTVHHEMRDLFILLSPKACYEDISDEKVLELELLLSANFFDYAQRNWKGVSEKKSKELGWYVDRKTLNYEALLDTLLQRKLSFNKNDEPVFRQYALLKKALNKYMAMQKSGGWPLISKEMVGLEMGDSSSLLIPLKSQLHIMGDLKEKDTTSIFDEKLTKAICVFQHRHGLQCDSVLGAKTIDALRVSVHERINQMLINIERSRWLPKDFHGDYLMVNIPDFKLLLYKNNKLNFSCKVVLGKQSTGTVIFNANMEYVVFSPYWNIPNSIIKKEIIPSILKNENYLEQHNMEIVTNDREVVKTSSIRWKEYLDKKFPYVIREKPGPSNSLGLVKFIFPNSHDIYLHDTPAKQLFSQTTRTFSHGCIRVEKPYELAQILLKNDTAWTNEKIKQNMNGGVELWVRLPQKMQVYIVYFTSWVDAAGAIQFRNDVYGHDKKMKKMLL